MGVSNAPPSNAPATKTKTIGRFSVEATVPKPKERQFQVVPVPCVFTRGRWKCWDFKIGTDVPGMTPDILEFAEKSTITIEKTQLVETPTTVKTTTPVTCAETETTFTHIITAPDTTASANDQKAERVAAPLNPNPKESSTIVVTSIEPAPVTPVHSTRDASVYGVDCTDGTDGRSTASTSSPTKHKTSCTFTEIRESPSIDIGRIILDDPPNYSPPAHNVSPPQSKNIHGLQLSRQASVNGFLIQDSSMIISPPNGIPTEESGTTTGPNIVAIDNKIEQAMDLVKTHLTFAVREEVEVLRSNIVDLEAKVSDLERQNQILRQFAPPDVLANLPMLMAQVRLPTAVLPQNPLSQFSGATQTIIQPAANRGANAAAPQVASSSSGGSPKGNEQQTPPSMIPKLSRPSGIPLPNSFFDSSGVQLRRSPEP